VKRFDFARPIRDESCESTRIATISHPQLLPSASRLPVKRFDFSTPIRDESCESTRTATVSHPQLLPSASRLAVRRFDFATTIRDESSESTRIATISHPPVIAYRRSISGETIRLCKKRFATNRANRLELSKISHPSYCLLRVDFQGNDSTLQENIPDQSSRLVKCLTEGCY